MAGIFFSWSSADKEGALALRDRLRGLGFLSPNDPAESTWKLWEYSEDMKGGDQLHDAVMDVIKRVRLAVICFSDETAEAKWISDEVAWCVNNLNAADRELRYIVPVRVGPHPEKKMPHLLADKSLAVLDASQSTDEQLYRVVEDIRTKLGDEAPVIVPAALFAMKTSDCDELFKAWSPDKDAATQALQNLCMAMGMTTPPPLYEMFRQRYGKTVEDFAPFYVPPDDAQADAPPRKRLMDIIGDVVRVVNRARTTRKQNPLPPIFLQWQHHELALAGAKWRDKRLEARALWESRESLLIVDSVSMLLTAIRDIVRDLPDLSRSALLWIPPYTQHVVKAQASLQQTVETVPRLGDALNKMHEPPLRSVAFDASSPIAVHAWLMRTLSGIVGEVAPTERTIDEIQKANPTRVRLRGGLIG